MLLSTIAIALPYQEAAADHEKIRVDVIIKRSGGFIVEFRVDIDASCGTDCAINIDMTNRDNNRFNRWCDTNPQEVVIDADGRVDFICEGKGPWELLITARTLSGTNQNIPNVHGDITVSVTAS